MILTTPSSLLYSVHMNSSDLFSSDGTTDVTRTIHLGTPTAHERRTFTLVLKGHIALARAVFPIGTSGRRFFL